MRHAGCVLAILLAASTAEAGVEPPKIGTWKTTADEGKGDAGKRNVPLLIFVSDTGEKAERLTKNLDEPAVTRVLGHFACVFLASDYNLAKFQGSYVPWIGATPENTHQPPVLIFGTPKGQNRDLRVENVTMNADQLVAHLEKVLGVLAPAELAKLRTETLEQSKFTELAKMLDEELRLLDSNLSESGLPKFKEELPWAIVTIKYAEAKASREFKDKDAKKKATDLLSDLKKNLAELQKFKGKDADKFKDPISKARDIAKSIQELHP